MPGDQRADGPADRAEQDRQRPLRGDAAAAADDHASNGLCQDWDAFEKDMVLIFNNAMTYNQKVTCDV